MHTLRKLRWVMETSLTKTLAHKLKVRVPVVYERYGATLVVEGKEYKGPQASIPRAETPRKSATWGGIPLSWDMKATVEDDPPKLYGNRTELVQRLLAECCELWGNDKEIEVLHVQAMRKLHEHPGRPKPEWVKRMIALKRKTLILCKRCHEAIEHGLPITWTLLPLEEVLKRRQF
jgi:Type II intron maturase